MTLQTEFVPLPLEELRATAHQMKDEGWRFIQTCAANGDAGIDLYYSFMKDGLARNYRIAGVTKDQPVPSITDIFLAAFVFENEARELFGVDMRDIAIDFGGGLYAPAIGEPMTIISPERKAAIDKARKAAAAKAQKTSGKPAESGASAQSAQGGARAALSPEKLAKLEERLKDMAPEKVAKVRAALAARQAEAEAAPSAEAKPQEEASKSAEEPKSAKGESQQPEQPSSNIDAELLRAISLLDPDKAARVKAAFGAEPAQGVPAAPGAEEASTAGKLDAELESKLATMDPEKASAVRRALAGRGTSKAGE